jgi:hypothetical protein
MYQMGDVQARSWIVFWIFGSEHPGGFLTLPAALQLRVEKRQLGFSKTRA